MKLEILNNGQVIETKDLPEGSHKIGRNSDCEIVLSSPKISKHHALLVVKNDKAAIVDTGSVNGVFVNGILVKKQRFGEEDTIDIGEFQIRIARPPKRKIEIERQFSGGAPSLDGNAARNIELDQGFAPPPEPNIPAPDLSQVSAQERLVEVMDNKILALFYAIVKVTDYRFVLASILIATMLGSVLATVAPVLSWGKDITKKECLNRAHAVLTQMVRENYRILNKSNDTTRLTVDAADKVDGFLNTYIIDTKTKNILAPAKYLNKAMTDPYAILAINDVLDGKETNVSKDKGDNMFVVAQAIPYYGNPDVLNSNEEGASGPPTPAALVIAYFQVPTSIDSTYEPLAIAGLISFCLSLLAFFLIFKMVSRPVSILNEQLDAALKGEDVQIDCQAKFPELETLATVINFSVTRMRQGGGGNAASPSGIAGGTDFEGEEGAYLKSIEEFCFGTSDGVLVLDRDKKVKYVSKVLEELLSLRPQYAYGQNISDACRDGSYSGTAIDLAERVVTSLGESQSASLDINGVARSMVAVGHRFSNGEIGFVIITVKMNG